MAWNFDKIPTDIGRKKLKDAYLSGDFQLMKEILFKHKVPSICSSCSYSHSDAGKWITDAIEKGIL